MYGTRTIINREWFVQSLQVVQRSFVISSPFLDPSEAVSYIDNDTTKFLTNSAAAAFDTLCHKKLFESNATGELLFHDIVRNGVRSESILRQNAKNRFFFGS